MIVAIEPGGIHEIADQRVNLSGLPDGATVLSKATINDPGIIRPEPALTALIPAGWTTQMGVVK